MNAYSVPSQSAVCESWWSMLIALSHLLKNTSGRVLFEEAGGGCRPEVYQNVGAVFQRGHCRLVKAVMARGMHLQRYALSFPTPAEAGHVPLPGFPRTREWLTKAEVTMTGVEEI